MYSKEEAIVFAESMRNSLKIMNEMGFADMNMVAPDIDFYPDGVQYFDSANFEIHIGVYGIIDLFEPEDEADFLSALNYVRGHEEQHCRSTPDKPYRLAISKAVQAILEYIQEKEEGFKRRFKTDADYEDFANRILPQKEIYISWEMVHKIMAGIANSLEDGRIERIRSNRFPGFENLRQVYRGKFWSVSDSKYVPYDDMKAHDKLTVITNQILSLATCQLYEKGFVSAYAGTALIDEIRAYHPHIAAAVMSGRCRGLLNPMVAIAKLLAPYVYEVCKLSYNNAVLQQMLESFIQSIISQMLDENNTNTVNEKNEDTDEGSLNATFPMSDLEITLDDATFDALEKNTRKTDAKGGILIKREHSKDAESGDGSPDKSQKQNSKKNENGSEGEGKNEEIEEKEGSEGEKSNSKASDSKNKQDDNTTSGSPSGSMECKDSKSHDSRSSNEEAKGNKNKSEEQKHVSKEQKDAAREEVEKAMKEAARQTRAESETNIETINAHAAASRSRGVKEVLDKSEPISPNDMKDICDFLELKRKYKVDTPLPAVLNARGKTLHRSNERYFRSISRPNVTFLDSGSIDPSRIYGLSFGDTDIFMKKGMDKVFDGCVYILIDNSGSMGGKKREEACKAAAVLEEGFRGLIPIKIVAFDYTGTVIHEVIKEWNESLRYNCCWNFFEKGRYGNGNEDGYDIQIATREILARPERKKLIIVLSDGAPGNRDYCREAIRNARKSGIQVTGIYFEEDDSYGYSADAFEYMYEKDFVICKLDELDSNLQRILKRFSRS